MNSSFPDRQSLRYSLTDIFNINKYGLQTFTNIPTLFAQKSVEKLYWINGGGGETIRRNWSKFGTLKKYIDDRIQRTNTYSRTLSQELANSTKVILNAALRNIGNRYKITGKEDTLIYKSDWYQKNSIGYIITSYVGKLSFVAKSETAGRIHLILRGLDKRNPSDSSKFIPYWIDYTKLIVNGTTLFDKLTPIWHDKFYRYDMTVKAGEEVTVQVE